MISNCFITKLVFSQAAITNEILEIVAGAEALGG